MQLSLSTYLEWENDQPPKRSDKDQASCVSHSERLGTSGGCQKKITYHKSSICTAAYIKGASTFLELNPSI